MIISQGRNYIFVHVPKTGGTSMALALEARAMADDIMIGDTPKAVKRRRRLKGAQARGRLWKHSTLSDIEGLVSDEIIAQAFVFTMVRNPWDRLVSYYHWLKVQTFNHPAVFAAKAQGFSDFLRVPVVACAIRHNTYSSYVTSSDGIEHCDLFVRLEHLDEDVPKLEAALDISLGALPRANASERPEAGSAYCAEDQALVAELCAEDIARFGYRFQD